MSKKDMKKLKKFCKKNPTATKVGATCAAILLLAILKPKKKKK